MTCKTAEAVQVLMKSEGKVLLAVARGDSLRQTRVRRSPRVHTSPNAPITVDDPAPVANRTRARLKLSPLATASRTFPSKFIKTWAASAFLHGNQWSPPALSVLDPETGQSLEHRALRRHPLLGPDWNTSYSNELGRLCQGIGVDPADPSKQRLEGTNIFHPIRYENIPLDRRKEIALSKVVCTFRPDKADPNRTRIAVAVQNIKYPGNIVTKTASLDLVKLLLNSVLSRQVCDFRHQKLLPPNSHRPP